jgi:hypothetical protein
MPSVIVLSESCLLTNSGWILAGEIPDRVSLFGTDRHGHLVSKEATITLLKESSKRAIIGTDASVGIFASKTRIVLKDGTIKTAAEVIEDTQQNDFWFENVLQFPGKLDENASATFLSTVLQTCAAFVVDDLAIVRCRSRVDDMDVRKELSQSGFCQFQKISADVFCLINQESFPKIRGPRFESFIKDYSVALWRNSEEECEEIDCIHNSCCLWYASDLKAMNVGYTLKYDSLQHSLTVKVVEDSSHKTPFRKCRCAFHHSNTPTSVLVTWEANSWTPIVSGFLVAGK